MARVLAVHGIAQQFKGPEMLSKDWGPALRDGVKLAGYDGTFDFDMAFYGNLFRRPGVMATGFPKRDVEDLSPYEGELLVELWKQAAAEDSSIPPPDAKTMFSARDLVRRAFNALSRVRLAVDLGDNTVIPWFVNQVYQYFHEPEIRAEAQRRVAALVREDTRVIVAHSLGSVVAYEALCAHPEWPVKTFVTIGSPLGIPNLVFERLTPAPRSGAGVWPGGVVHWTNVSAKGDFVAVQRRLANCFGSPLEDVAVDNGGDTHGACRYLTSTAVGAAIARELAEEHL